MTDWADEAFAERERMLRATFGEPGAVVPFPTETLGTARLARGSVLLFPPAPAKKRPWLFVTNGLAQPTTPDALGDAREHEAPRRSGHGFEVAIAAREPDEWAPLLLLQLVTYAANEAASVKPGARVPFLFTRPRESTSPEVTPALGSIPRDHVSAGELIALVLWPLLELEGPFVASTGRFDLMVGTGITKTEWELAKETTSSHILRLLALTGVGQATDPLRPSVTASEPGKLEWERLKGLSRDQVLDALYGPA